MLQCYGIVCGIIDCRQKRLQPFVQYNEHYYPATYTCIGILWRITPKQNHITANGLRQERWDPPASIIQLFISSNNSGTSQMRLDTLMIYRLHYTTFNWCVKRHTSFHKANGSMCLECLKTTFARRRNKKSLKYNLGEFPYRNVCLCASIGCMPVLAWSSSHCNDDLLCISCFTVLHKKNTADVRSKSFQRWRSSTA